MSEIKANVLFQLSGIVVSFSHVHPGAGFLFQMAEMISYLLASLKVHMFYKNINILQKFQSYKC